MATCNAPPSLSPLSRSLSLSRERDLLRRSRDRDRFRFESLGERLRSRRSRFLSDEDDSLGPSSPPVGGGGPVGR